MYQLIIKGYWRNFLLLLLVGNVLNSFSQSLQREAFVSAGNFNSTTSGYSLQSSIGELAVASSFTSTINLTQGFIQNEQPGVIVSASQLNDLKFKAYPNPVSSQYTIELFSALSEDIKIEIFDITGRKIEIAIDHYSENKNQFFVLNMSSITSGSYIIKAYSEKTRYSQVFMVSKI